MGTLDSLLSLSDDLVKTTTLVEAVVAKVRRQLVELEGTSEEAAVRSGGWGLSPGSLRGTACEWWTHSRGGPVEEASGLPTASAVEHPACTPLRALLEAQLARGPHRPRVQPQQPDARVAVLLSPPRVQAAGLSVDGVPVKRFISGFVWNEAKCVLLLAPASCTAPLFDVTTRPPVPGTRLGGRCGRRLRSWRRGWPGWRRS